MEAICAMNTALRTYPDNVVLGAMESDEGFIFGLGTPSEIVNPPIPGGLSVAVDKNDGRVVRLLPGSEAFYRFRAGARTIDLDNLKV